MFVMALRNAEVVFNKAVFTKAAFKKDGATEVLDLATSKMHPAHAAVLRPDTPWVSLFDETKGIGFAALYLDLATPNLNGGLASLAQPFIYIENGPWYYVSRGFVYSFALEQPDPDAAGQGRERLLRKERLDHLPLPQGPDAGLPPRRLLRHAQVARGHQGGHGDLRREPGGLGRAHPDRALRGGRQVGPGRQGAPEMRAAKRGRTAEVC